MTVFSERKLRFSSKTDMARVFLFEILIFLQKRAHFSENQKKATIAEHQHTKNARVRVFSCRSSTSCCEPLNCRVFAAAITRKNLGFIFSVENPSEASRRLRIWRMRSARPLETPTGVAISRAPRRSEDPHLSLPGRLFLVVNGSGDSTEERPSWWVRERPDVSLEGGRQLCSSWCPT